MRKITGDLIFDGTKFHREMQIILDGEGKILEFSPLDRQDKLIEKFEGVLSPGFINSHCHLELSFLKDQIPQQTGLADFVYQVVTKRSNFEQEFIVATADKADKKMFQAGIQGVGDICNSDSTFTLKRNSPIQYFNFIEVLALNPERAFEVLDAGIKLMDKLRSITPHAKASITPHAPYSASEKLLSLISNIKQEILTIHNQETEAENEFFRSGEGQIAKLYRKLNLSIDHFKPTGENSIAHCLSQLNRNPLVLVHNTFTRAKDIEHAKNTHDDLFWCACPSANLYIENKLPEINTWYEKGLRITIGTDSLASNSTLDILHEIKIIHQNFPSIPLREIMTWATLNGAQALGFEYLGKIEAGKKPGLIQIKKMSEEMLAEKAEVFRII